MGHLVHTAALSRHNYIRVLRAVSSQDMSIKERDSTASPGSLFQCFSTHDYFFSHILLSFLELVPVASYPITVHL